MPYAATVRWFRNTTSEDLSYTVEVTETNAGSADEWCTRNSVTGHTGVTVLGPQGTPADLPIPYPSGRFEHFVCDPTAGTAVNVTPALSWSAGAAAGTTDYIGGQDSAATNVNDGTRLEYDAPLGHPPTLFGRSNPDAGADNSITTRFRIVGD